MSTVRFMLALPFRQKTDALSLLLVIVFIELSLRLLRLNRVAKVLGVRIGLNQNAREIEGRTGELSLTAREWQRLDLGARILRRGPFNGTCLRRALLAGFVLRRHEHAVRLGVRSVEGQIAAHAWLEVDGISLEPDADELFARLVLVPEVV